jgi:hypothetical protein
MKPQNKSHAVMAQRNPEDKDSLDSFPTPPWATRALVEIVLGFTEKAPHSVWEPACGEGHMAKVLKEKFDIVIASDIHPYGYGVVQDFLDPECVAPCPIDLIITNPPFKHAEQFINKSLQIANVGVAMLTRTVFLEGKGRYNRLFKDNPPSTVAVFTERVPMVKDRLDRNASSATSYAWLVWDKFNFDAPRMSWIPPCRKQLEKDSDYE